MRIYLRRLLDSQRLGPDSAPGVWKLNSPALLTKLVFGSIFADTRSESSHGKVENGERHIPKT